MATQDTSVELYKHYSNIRFLMLPMFFTTIGALVVAYWTVINKDGASNTLLASWVSGAGIAVSILFCIYEWRLSKAFGVVSERLPEQFVALRPTSGTWGWVTSITLLVYAIPGFFWLYMLFC